MAFGEEPLDLVTQNLLKRCTATEGLVWANITMFALSVPRPAIITTAFRSRHFCGAVCHCLTFGYEGTITK